MRWKIYIFFSSLTFLPAHLNYVSYFSLDFARTWNDIYSEFYAIFYSSYTILKQFTCDDEHQRCESEFRVYCSSSKKNWGVWGWRAKGWNEKWWRNFWIFSTTMLRCVKIVLAIFSSGARIRKRRKSFSHFPYPPPPFKFVLVDASLLLPPSSVTIHRNEK